MFSTLLVIFHNHINTGFRVDVTIFQRSPTYVMSGRAKTAMSEGIYCENGPPLEVADCLNASFPTAFMIRGLAQRMTASLAEMDKCGYLSNQKAQNSCGTPEIFSMDLTKEVSNEIWALTTPGSFSLPGSGTHGYLSQALVALADQLRRAGGYYIGLLKLR